MRVTDSYTSPTSRRSAAPGRALHAFLTIIGLGIVLGATSVHAGEDVDANALRLLVVPVGIAFDGDVATGPDLLSAAPSNHRRSARFPRLPAVNVTGYNVAVLHRLHADVAAKLTVGLERQRPLAAEQLTAAVGLGLELQF